MPFAIAALILLQRTLHLPRDRREVELDFAGAALIAGRRLQPADLGRSPARDWPPGSSRSGWRCWRGFVVAERRAASR